MGLLNALSKKGSDNYQTPVKTLIPLIPFIKNNWQVWECACGNGNLVKELESKGRKVFSSDIIIGGDKVLNFLLDKEIENFDCIITNPPYSLKNEFIERCYKLNKPFALLLPLTALETQRRQNQWKRGLQLLLLNKRVNYEDLEIPQTIKKGCFFSSAWFTFKLNLPQDITFGEI